MNYRPLTQKEEQISQAITNAANAVHKELGAGLLEKVYETCMAHLIVTNQLDVKQNFDVPIFFMGKKFDAGLKANLVVGDLAIVEIKAADENNDVWEKQMLSFLKLTGLKLGFIINFNNPNLARNGIKRFAL